MSEDEAARREKEREALLKVRGLVDQAQAEERAVNKVDRNWILQGGIAVAVVAALAVAVVYGVRWYRADEKKALEAQREAARVARIGSPPMPTKFGKRHVQLEENVDPMYRAYVADCFARLEKRAHAANRNEVKGVAGRAKVRIEVRGDGNVQDVVVSDATGDAAVEPTARRVIRMSEPCGVFPLEMQAVADYVHIPGTVQIDGASPDKVLAFTGAPR